VYQADTIILETVQTFSTIKFQKMNRSEENTFDLNIEARICSAHFKEGKKKDRQHLPSFFPWSKKNVERRVLKRILPDENTVIPKKVKLVNEEEAAFPSEKSSALENETNIGITTTSVEAQTDILVETRSIGTQTDPLEDLQTKINQLEKEICDLQDKLENARFDIDQFKDSPKDIAFFTGFADYETLLCFDILKESAENLSYGYKRK